MGFETAPAQQAQVDFAKFCLPWGKRHALLAVLANSRRMWLRFYRQQTLMVAIRGLEESFSYLGGVLAELLFDQMKALVIKDRRATDGATLRYTDGVWSARFELESMMIEGTDIVAMTRESNDMYDVEHAPLPADGMGDVTVDDAMYQFGCMTARSLIQA